MEVRRLVEEVKTILIPCHTGIKHRKDQTSTITQAGEVVPIASENCEKWTKREESHLGTTSSIMGRTKTGFLDPQPL